MRNGIEYLFNPEEQMNPSGILARFEYQVEYLKNNEKDKTTAKILDVAGQFLLDRLDQLPEQSLEYQQIIQQMEMSLGNCTTPIKQLLFSIAVQLPPEIRTNLPSSKIKEIQQRIAFRHALLRSLRQRNCNIYDLSEHIEDISNILFSKGSYNFNISFFAKLGLSRKVGTQDILIDLNLINKKGVVKNPKGPKSGTFRVLRGGSWFYPTECLPSAYRSGYTYGEWGSSNGFRCVAPRY